MALRHKKRERIEGDIVAAEVIESRIKAAERARADKTQKMGRRTTARNMNATGNDDVHRLNDSDRQLDAQDHIERDSELPAQFHEAKRLDAPPPRPGYAQRWCAFRKGSEEDQENFDTMLEEGWRPVRRSKTRRALHELAASSQGTLGQYYVKRGMILMEVPEKLKIQRDRYFRDLNKRQNDGVNKSMFKVNNRIMPLLQPERSTRASLRARKGRLEVAEDEVVEA
jgi:hypothetical protein